MDEKRYVRLMRPEDVSAAADIERAAMSEPWNETAFLEALANPCAVCLSAFLPQNAQIAGYCILYHAADEGEIVTVAVKEVLRRQGLGDALLIAALQSADSFDLGAVWLEVRESNTAAICLYEKHGFAAAGKRKNFYRAPQEDALVMVRRPSK